MIQFQTTDMDPAQPHHPWRKNLLIHTNEHPDGLKFAKFVRELDNKLTGPSLLIMDNASYHCYDKPNDPTSYEKYTWILRPIYFAPNITAEVSPIDVRDYGIKHILWNADFNMESIWTAIDSICNTIDGITKSQVEAAWQRARLCVDEVSA